MYIKDQPCGKDLFDSSAHNKTAEAIADVIKNEKMNIDIIGLEGDWGSGKSNVIDILRNKIKETHHVFIYDAWGHQEDLQRRSFLEELTEDLCEHELLENIVSWMDKLENLLARKTKKTSKSIPKLNMKVFYLLILIFMNNITNRVEYSIFDNMENLVFKEIVLALVRNSPIIIAIIVKLIANLSIFSKEKNLTYGKRLGEEIGELLKVYNNKELESTVESITSTREPSVREFKKWMNELSNELKKELIIVFDNMDRLENDKAKNLWSSIHTFFSETEYEKIYVIVPFDRIQIRKIFASENTEKTNFEEADRFIDKTFELVYRVTPPVISDWKTYFDLKFEEISFECDEEEVIVIRTLFDGKHKYIKPREIILFLNELYLYHLLWGNQIPLRYIGLFILNKNEITKNPIEEIINQNYLVGYNYFFDENVQQYLAALVYNVSPGEASQVLLSREIEKSLNSNDIKRFGYLTKASAFESVFENIVNGIESYNNGILAIYETMYKVNNETSIFRIANDVFKKKFFEDTFGEYRFEEFIQKLILMNLDSAVKIMNHFLGSVSTNREIEGEQYYQFIQDIELFIKDNNLDYNLCENITEVKMSITEMFKYIEVSKFKDSTYKVRAKAAGLSKKLEEMINNNVYIQKEIDLLVYMPESCSVLDNVKTLLKQKIALKQVPYNLLDKFYTIAFSMNDFDSSYLYDLGFIAQNLYNRYSQKEKYIYIMIAMLLKHMEDEQYVNKINSSYRSGVNSSLELVDAEVVDGVMNYVNKFLDINDILNLVIKYDKPLINQIMLKLMENYDSTLNLEVVIKKYDEIKLKLGINDKEFFKFLSLYTDEFNEVVKSSNIFIAVTSTAFVTECFTEVTKFRTAVINEMIEYFSDKKHDYYEKLFIDPSQKIEFISLYELINGSYYDVSVDMNLAYRSALEELLGTGSINIKLKEIFDIIYEKINKVSLRTTFTNIRTTLNNGLEIENIDQDYYIPLIMRHGRLNEEPNKSIDKIVVPILKVKPELILRDEYDKKLIDLANRADGEKIILRELLESLKRTDLVEKINLDDEKE